MRSRHCVPNAVARRQLPDIEEDNVGALANDEQFAVMRQCHSHRQSRQAHHALQGESSVCSGDHGHFRMRHGERYE